MSQLFDAEFLRKIELLKLATQKALAKSGEGEKDSHKKGNAIDFIDFRSYSPGDELRYVDWNIYARQERLYIKEFAKEESLSVNILLDTSPSMDFGTPRKLDYAKKIVAILAYVALLSRDKVTIHSLSPSEYRGENEIDRVLKLLEKVQTDNFTFAERLSRLSVKSNSVWLIISDFWEFEEMKERLKLIPAQGSDLVLIHILSKDELNPDLQGKFRLMGAEEKDSVDRFIGAEEIREYNRLVNDYVESCKNFSLTHNINYVFAPTDTGLDTFALVYLRKAGILR